ncbi:carbohydrate ABC transporter permease [Oceanicola granulosus]|nr:sugar ABC transporter permease [Oceanicola granulosus]
MTVTTDTVVATSSRRRRRPVSHMVPWLFISPWIIGFVAFTLGPMLFSLYMSFFDWPIVGERTFIGLDNYVTMTTLDPQFWESLWITVKFALLFVPLNIAVGFLLALLLNAGLKGTGVLRTLFYLPSVISGVALVTIFSWLYSYRFGVLNYLLGFVGIDGPNWLGDPSWALVAIVFASLWGVGSTMLILLAGLQAIPRELYEAARISGVPAWARTLYITLPMLGPMLLFSIITSIISAFQQLTLALLLTEGGPLGSTYFFAMYIYDNAFKYFDMGYAAAMSWIMFGIVLLLSLAVMKSSSAWVHYEGEVRGKKGDKS